VQLARRGQLETARETLKKAVALASDRQGNVFPVASMALAYLAELHREAGEVEPARRTLEQAITLSRGWRASTAMSAYVVLARLHAMHGEHEQADQAIQVALRLAGQTEETRMDDFSINAERARLWALAGRFDRVAEWARQLASQTEKLASEEEQFILRRMDKYHTLVLARLAIASGSPAEALQMLEAQLPVLEQQGRTSMVIENLALQALAWDVRGEYCRALEKLERAAWLAYRGQYFRLLLDEGPPLLALLARLRAECAAQPEQNAELLAYLDRLLAGQPMPAPAGDRTVRRQTGQPGADRAFERARAGGAALAGCRPGDQRDRREAERHAAHRSFALQEYLWQAGRAQPL
jgi:LuxR family transcriptional regulator, maltose regulon positive regulatory protein